MKENIKMYKPEGNRNTSTLKSYLAKLFHISDFRINYTYRIIRVTLCFKLYSASKNLKIPKPLRQKVATYKP